MRAWQTSAVPTPSERLADAVLYLVCDERPDAFLHHVLEGGVDVVQLRMKGHEDDAILATAKRFAAVCDRYGALFVLNDRPDLAVSAGAGGVHLGQDDAPVSEARSLVGPDRLIGLSTHTPRQIEVANQSEVDYIGVGPVYATPTKPGRAPVGLDLVRYATEQARMPWFAIGGVNERNIRDVHETGAQRVAVVRALTEAAAPGRTAAQLRTALSERKERVGSA